MKIPATLGADTEADLLLEISALARRTARRIVGTDAARDVAQDIVLELLVRMREGAESIDPARLPGLVCEMARCRARDQLRRERRREKPNGDFMRELTDSTHSWMHPDAAVHEAELTAFRESSLEKLPERCRAAYLLVREEGLSYAEAGTRLGMSTRSVHAQVARAQRLFREELPQQGVPVTSSGHGGRLAYRRRKVEGTPGQRPPPPSTTWMMARSPPSSSPSKWRKKDADKARQHAAVASER
jgi:RNA polymerase sigma-70 factor (ECF subfamily)